MLYSAAMYQFGGVTFTLVGNVCPLTRIATATIVPPREPIPIVKSTDKPVVTLVYTRKPKVKKVPNKMEPNKSWGSSSNVSSSLTDCRLSKSSFGNVCPLTRIATATMLPHREPIPIVQSTDKPVVTLVYTRKPRAKNVPSKVEPNKSWGSSSNVSTSITDCRLSKSSFGTVNFGNDHVANIMGYGDYQIGNMMISRVYYVKGLGHNLFSVGQFCDSDLEVAFRQHTCFIRNLEGV
nr:integrase, catalytic region, zinc finger, CCHC-type, peptidase aspartic, catalytic [Tanacetum cinerariifolium]